MHEADDDELASGFLALLEQHGVDMTVAFRALTPTAAGDVAALHALVADAGAVDTWVQSWRARLDDEGRTVDEVVATLDHANPVYVPRNRLVEEALAAAVAGDLGPAEELLEVITHPFTEQPDRQRYALPSGPEATRYRTFCGT